MTKLEYVLFERSIDGHKILGYYKEYNEAIYRQLSLLADQIANCNGIYKTFHVKNIREFSYGN